MSNRSFNAVTGVIGALALGALIGACAAVYRTCRASGPEVSAVAATVAGTLVFGMLLGRWLQIPTRVGFLAAAMWLLTMSAGLWIFARRMIECFNT